MRSGTCAVAHGPTWRRVCRTGTCQSHVDAIDFAREKAQAPCPMLARNDRYGSQHRTVDEIDQHPGRLSRTQATLVLFSAGAELYAMGAGVAELLFVNSFFLGALFRTKANFIAHAGSPAVESFASWFGASRRIRRIDLRFLFVRGLIIQGGIAIKKVDGELNPADIFAKRVRADVLAGHLERCGMVTLGDYSCQRLSAAIPWSHTIAIVMQPCVVDLVLEYFQNMADQCAQRYLPRFITNYGVAVASIFGVSCRATSKTPSYHAAAQLDTHLPCNYAQLLGMNIGTPWLRLMIGRR
jgi:hypothetical protein